jgi:predicted sulfurtransferase
MDRLFEFVGNHIELTGLFVALLAALWFSEKLRSGKAVSPQAATLMMNKDEAVIIDIREKKEYSEGRITGSIHIPYDSLKERMPVWLASY